MTLAAPCGPTADPPAMRLERLHEHAAAVLAAVGLSDANADLVAGSLVDAEARGIRSHGLARLRIYTTRLREGRVDAGALPVVTTAGSVVRVDARNAPGQVAAVAGLEAGMRIAAEHGIAMVGVRNSNHCGTLAYFTRKIAVAGYAAIAMSTAPPTMIYHGGRTRAVGTNPISLTVPRPGGRPIVVDMATSTTARGKIILAEQAGQQIPPDWAVDENGRPTTDPAAALRGSMVPFGGPKGSAFAMMVDLLCGALVGGAFGPEIGDMYDDWDRPQRVSHLFVIMAIATWDEVGDFSASVEQFARRVAELPPGAGHDRVLLPGEIEDGAFEAARREGISVPGVILADLDALAAEVGIASRLLDEARKDH